MKSSRATFPSAQPDPRLRVYLFHGADEANSRALARRLQHARAAEKRAFTGASLKSTPGALLAEASAISMFGEAQILWVEPAGEETLEAVQLVLDAPAADHPVAVIAGTLKKTSGLLKAVEAHPLGLAHVSYVPEGRDAVRLVSELGRGEGLRINPPVAAEIATRAGNDQAVIAQELLKLALYLQASPESPKDLEEEVLDLLGADASETDSGRVGDLALSGDIAALAAELERLESSGIDAIPVVRMLQRRLIMLAGLRARIDGGQHAEQVLASVWRRDREVAAKALPRWSGERLAGALDRVVRLERSLMLSGVPDRAALGEELLAIARAAQR